MLLDLHSVESPDEEIKNKQPTTMPIAAKGNRSLDGVDMAMLR